MASIVTMSALSMPVSGNGEGKGSSRRNHGNHKRDKSPSGSGKKDNSKNEQAANGFHNGATANGTANGAVSNGVHTNGAVANGFHSNGTVTNGAACLTLLASNGNTPSDTLLDYPKTDVKDKTKKEKGKKSKTPKEKNKDKLGKVNPYIRVLEQYPYVVIIFIILLNAACCAAIYFWAPLPDFSQDGAKGCKARATPIEKSTSTLQRLFTAMEEGKGKWQEPYTMAPNHTKVTQYCRIQDDWFSTFLNYVMPATVPGAQAPDLPPELAAMAAAGGPGVGFPPGAPAQNDRERQFQGRDPRVGPGAAIPPHHLPIPDPDAAHAGDGSQDQPQNWEAVSYESPADGEEDYDSYDYYDYYEDESYDDASFIEFQGRTPPPHPIFPSDRDSEDVDTGSGEVPAPRRTRRVAKRHVKKAPPLGGVTSEACTAFNISDRDIYDHGYKFLFEPLEGDDLLTVSNLRSICLLESRHIAPYAVADCALKSLPRLLLAHRGKPSVECLALDQDDVTYARDILSTCAGHYYNGSLFRNQAIIQMGEGPITVPFECIGITKFIHEFLFYLAPSGYYKSGEDGFTNLKVVLTFTYKELRIKSEQYYEENLQDQAIADDNVRMVAVEAPNQFDLRYHFFNKYLVDDLRVYFAIAMALVMILIVLYTRSVILMFATLLNVIFSFILATSTYYFICRITYFPFLNVMAALVLIAVGADNVFIFYDTWLQIIARHDKLPLSHVMARTFAHAALAIFVTSLTTAAAFFANIISTINCVRCFGIFAGLCILCNFFLMVTWTPSVIVCVEKASRWLSDIRTKSRKKSGKQSKNPDVEKNVKEIVDKFKMAEADREEDAEAGCCGGSRNAACDNSQRCSLTEMAHKFWGTTFPNVIAKTWFVWITLLSILGLGSIVCVFVTPRLQLPEGKDFRLFPDPNVLENWDVNFADKFSFSLLYEDMNLPFFFVFGFEPEGASWHTLNDSEVAITPDPNFDFYSKKSQTWLLNFCHQLKNQSFVSEEFRRQPCAIEAWGESFQKYCQIPGYKDKVAPCCTSYQAPYGPRDLEACLPVAETLNGVTGLYNASAMLGKPIYGLDNKVRGFFYVVVSKLSFSFSYETMRSHYAEVSSFFQGAMKDAPEGLSSGIFSGNGTMEFYDLQAAVADGTFVSIALSLAVAFAVMLVTSLNILISLYAFVTISFAILGTVAATVLLGWHLDIAESITISLAVGLSIDFTIHYGVAYRVSPHHGNKARTRESFARVGAAVAMAALTTFAAGASIIPTHVLCYQRLGIFLVLCMVMSWVYSTFLFQSLCYIIGPSGTFCQIGTRCDKKRQLEYMMEMEVENLHKAESVPLKPLTNGFHS